MRPPWLASPPSQVRDDAAGPLDDRDQWQDVVGLQARLDHEVDLPEREQAVIVAIAAEAPEPHGAVKVGEALALVICGEQSGAGAASSASPSAGAERGCASAASVPP